MKKRTKIPFLGHTRKKSNQSGALSPYASTGACGSTDVTELPSSGGPIINRCHSKALPPLASSPSQTTASEVAIPVKTPTLGSKLAAHFSPSRTHKLTWRRDMTPTSGPSQLATTRPSSSLSSPSAASFDSRSSIHRSPTPQPGPNFMVWLSPDEVEEYKDLFTSPRSRLDQKLPSHKCSMRMAQKSSNTDATLPGPSSTFTCVKSPIQTSIPYLGTVPSIIVNSTSSHRQSLRNLKRSRPSIAQVLEKTPATGDVLGKL